MTFTIKPSEVYGITNKNKIKNILKGYKILKFRIPDYSLDSYLAADTFRVEGPFKSDGSSLGDSPRFIVEKIKNPDDDFPEWE